MVVGNCRDTHISGYMYGHTPLCVLTCTYPMHIHLFTLQYGYMYGHTHGSGGACMDTHMVVGVHQGCK